MNGNQYIWIFNGISLMLSFGVLTGHLLENVALKQKAVQSSARNSGYPGRAVDGRRDPNFQHGSCTLTNLESDPWWRVDLQNVYKISAVMITNSDSNENRLDGGEIWIGNSVEINDPNNRRCAVISHIPRSHTLYFPCSAAEGRYITVRLPGREKVLSLCEVEVYPEDTCAHSFANVALKGDATQSSTLSFADASKAIDGRRNSFYTSGSCSHTAEDETNPWWRVDLKRTYTVVSVKITNRGDCCPERLDGAEIYVGDSLENNGNDNNRCASISHIRAGKTYIYHCDGGSMAGRFVNVIIPGERKTLTLCEVEVYAVSAVEPQHNVALGKTAEESSSSYMRTDRPISGCTSVIFTDGCCSHTHESNDPWWRVDLADVYKVSAVTITNRGDCCQERLLGAEIWIGSSLQFKNFSCGLVSSRWDLLIHTFQCEGREGRYVSVTIPGISKIITLCAVEVYASLAVPDVVPSPSPTTLLLSATPPPPPPPTVSMLLSGRSVAMVADRLCWSDALLYCRLHHWDLLSLDSQEEQREMEELLRRSPFPLTGFVWLGLRRHIMSDVWFWMSGASIKFTKWPRDSPPDLHSNPCGGVATGGHHLWEDQPCQEPLNFICQSRAEDGEEGRVYFYSTRKGLSEG